jgi:voltage-gated potassium channel
MSDRSSIVPFVGAVLLVAWFVIGTAGFMFIEHWSLIDSLYMTIITITTVGFRAVHPLSEAGRVFASFIIVGGLGTAVYTFTRLGQLVLEGELLDILGRRRMKSDLEKLRFHTIVCGYGRNGKPVAEGLHRDGSPL